MSGFDRLLHNLEELASVPSRVSAEAAESISHLIDEEFSRGENPYGDAWAALRPRTLAKGRTAPPLTDSHAGRDSITVRPMGGAGIEIDVGEAYMGVHQAGCAPHNLAKRMILPDQSELPDEWQDAIGGSFSRGVAQAMGGR